MDPRSRSISFYFHFRYAHANPFPLAKSTRVLQFADRRSKKMKREREREREREKGGTNSTRKFFPLFFFPLFFSYFTRGHLFSVLRAAQNVPAPNVSGDNGRFEKISRGKNDEEKWLLISLLSTRACAFFPSVFLSLSLSFPLSLLTRKSWSAYRRVHKKLRIPHQRYSASIKITVMNTAGTLFLISLAF